MILFTLFIFLHNWQVIFNTRNLPFFSLKTQKQPNFSSNNSKTESKPNGNLTFLEKKAKEGGFTRLFTQADIYSKDMLTRSVSRVNTWLLSLFFRIKGLINGVKELASFSSFSLKYRFFCLENALSQWRENLVWLLEGNFATREAHLGKAFVFAQLSGAPEELYHSFKVIGILHLIAASSANIYLLLGFAWPLSFFLKHSFGMKVQAVFNCILTMLYFYMVNASFNLVEASPSILRASLMVILSLCAHHFAHLAVKTVYLLFLVGTICLVINPFYLQSLGFQLSFFASFVLIFYWPYMTKKIGKSSLTLSFTVQFFLWPILLLYFTSINLIAIPANVILSPLVELISLLFFTFLALKSFQLGVLADLLASLIAIVSNIFFSLLGFLEKIPYKAIEIEEHKTLIISSFLLIDLVITFFIFRQKRGISKINKYRVLAKWANGKTLL